MHQITSSQPLLFPSSYTAIWWFYWANVPDRIGSPITLLIWCIHTCTGTSYEGGVGSENSYYDVLQNVTVISSSSSHTADTSHRWCMSAPSENCSVVKTDGFLWIPYHFNTAKNVLHFTHIHQEDQNIWKNSTTSVRSLHVPSNLDMFSHREQAGLGLCTIIWPVESGDLGLWPRKPPWPAVSGGFLAKDHHECVSAPSEITLLCHPWMPRLDRRTPQV
jgi:hypothetical protein